ncbi:MAG: 16S rRNA (cytosine(1402)-N(4))-methyltransferase RsmH [Planctomycetota bacterium]|nr:MAG: 16S rRNA (cytosine(1402)-N(4))-methyltransferase RsmH [Planctomycetota bacterium]
MYRSSGSFGPSRHEPVLVAEVLEALAPARGGWFVDATVGGGGHAARLLEASPDVSLIAVDRDASALERARERLSAAAGRVQFVHAPFSALETIVPAELHGRIAGILADLGVSSDQIEDRERGFSFLHDGPLDMRMDAGTQKTSAAVLLARASEDEISEWLAEYGEERFARRIAHALVEARRRGPLLRTSQLAAIVERCVPRGRQHLHPATRTFQALRIAVNRELDEIEALLRSAPRLLAPGGRLAVISFHSLEDRRVKQAFRNECRSGQFVERHRAGLRPADGEVQRNARARSARLRVLERVEAA